MDAEGVPIWYVFNQSDMCSPEQPERLCIKTVNMHHLIAYVPEPPTCTIEPHGHYDELQGIYTCSNCGQQWQFTFGDPEENGWTCCPKCRAIIKED